MVFHELWIVSVGLGVMGYLLLRAAKRNNLIQGAAPEMIVRDPGLETDFRTLPTYPAQR
jgi:hypothetical protein